ncbi:MAG: RluA family pseudouridine synthase [Sulfurimonas sp.]|uniref:RluA family pseudouridine synthase n=1 Tax=Sulfurimonas sp. TaxID=2022749 RepID=UPI003565FDE1
MPFVTKKMFSQERERAFLFFKRELGYSQRDIQRYISVGRVLVNGVPITKPSDYLEGEFEFIYFEPISKGLAPHTVDEKFVVFDKPSGMLIHPQNRHTEYSLIDELKAQFGMEANIAHRIDQETSGLVLCAKDKKSEVDIKMMFQERDMKKKYLAMVHGELKDELRIDAPLLRYDDEKSALVRMVVKVDPSGKESLTHVRPLKYFPDFNMTMIECSPHTGRQHQIRVHMFHVKHPIVGDPVYGQSEDNVVKYLDRELDRDTRVKLSGARRLLLHANELEFELYGKNYNVKSSVNFEKVCFENMDINR